MTVPEQAGTPHLVALDVDGTTINHAGELSPVVRDAVHAVVAAGHHVIIATGRSIVATYTVAAPSGGWNYRFNGTYTGANAAPTTFTVNGTTCTRG